MVPRSRQEGYGGRVAVIVETVKLEVIEAVAMNAWALQGALTRAAGHEVERMNVASKKAGAVEAAGKAVE